MVKKNFPQPYQKPAGVRSSARQFNNQILANVSQIPDNGYMDFNNMNVNQTTSAQSVPQVPKKKVIKNKQKNKLNNQQQAPQAANQNPQAWRKNKNMPQQHGPPMNPKFHMNAQRGFQLNGGPMLRGNMNNIMPNMPFARRPMQMAPHAFQRPPMMPPIPPHMVPMRPPMPPMNMPPVSPQFMRRSNRRPPINGNGSFKKQMFPRPPINMPPMNMPMPPMMGGGPPRLPIPFNAMGPSPGKIKKPNPKVVKKIVKGKSTIKTLKNLQNQYPLDKPWVNDEIRTEHSKKLEIENQLKGNKDDELFAQFKTQRDKFVALYEAAREEHLKNEAAQVKTKETNGKQANNKNNAKNGKNNEQNVNANASSNANANSNEKA